MDSNQVLNQDTHGPHDARPDVLGAERFTPKRDAPTVLKTYFKNEQTVTMLFPSKVNLRLDNGKVVTFEAGPQEVPASLKDHWYLKANKVVLYEPKPPKITAPIPPPPLNPADEEETEEETQTANGEETGESEPEQQAQDFTSEITRRPKGRNRR